MQNIAFAYHIICTFLTKSAFAEQFPEWLTSKQNLLVFSEAGFSCKLFSLLADVNQLRCEVIVILWHITEVLGWRISKKNKQRIKLWESLPCSWKQQSLMSELSQQPKLNNALKSSPASSTPLHCFSDIPLLRSAARTNLSLTNTALQRLTWSQI